MNYEWCSEAMRARRESLLISQEALAERLGVHRNTIARWEGGDVPKVTDAFSIAAALDVTVSGLVVRTIARNGHEADTADPKVGARPAHEGGYQHADGSEGEGQDAAAPVAADHR